MQRGLQHRADDSVVDGSRVDRTSFDDGIGRGVDVVVGEAHCGQRLGRPDLVAQVPDRASGVVGPATGVLERRDDLGQRGGGRLGVGRDHIRQHGRVGGRVRQVEGAAELTAQLAAQNAPPAGVTAFIVPSGLRGGSASASSNTFVQNIEEVVSVVLIMGHADRTGGKALPRLDECIDQVLAAICGWAPDGCVGVFRLTRAATFDFQPTRVAYQIEFAVEDQLRIIT